MNRDPFHSPGAPGGWGSPASVSLFSMDLSIRGIVRMTASDISTTMPRIVIAIAGARDVGDIQGPLLSTVLPTATLSTLELLTLAFFGNCITAHIVAMFSVNKRLEIVRAWS